MPHRLDSSAGSWLRSAPALVLFALALFLALPVVDAGAGRARDNDRDGLSNKSEKSKYKTDWRRRDTDGDRLGDGAEVLKYRSNPLRKDTDGDRLKDGIEVLKYRTSPRRSDTDRDGLSDWREIRRYRTNPRRKDTDGDGLVDGAEVRKYKTSPRRKDTDGDGISDGVEVLRGLNPLVKNSAGGGGAAPGPSAPAPAPSPARGRPSRACTTVVSSTAAAQGALAGAPPGAVICMADGSYGRLGLNARKAGEVVVQAQNPGRATIAGASISGSNITLALFAVVGDELTLEPGSDHLTVEYNRISGGYFGVDAGPTTDTSISDTTIRGNRFVGPFGEDALRVNRYHDGPDADPYGILIDGNEITGVRENGSHSDCLQSVWGGDSLYFTRNYLHDNRCQGFFVKDQPSTVNTIVVDDNLMLRNAAPCDGDPGCGQPAIYQVVGPTNGLSIQRNTFWTPEGGSTITVRSGPFGPITSRANVIYREWSDWGGGWPGFTDAGNIVCERAGTWPGFGAGSRSSCSPPFVAPATDDYRLTDGSAGVDWRPADQPYGP